MTNTETGTAVEQSSAVLALPVCPSNSSHGRMELRPLSQQTKEHSFCGVWYDCVEAGCHSSVLVQSEALRAQLAESMERLKATYSALSGKRMRERYLKGCAPWVVAELTR